MCCRLMLIKNKAMRLLDTVAMVIIFFLARFKSDSFSLLFAQVQEMIGVGEN